MAQPFAYKSALMVLAIAAMAVEERNARGQQLAFPGAEGFGALTVGGRGGDVYHVANLNDSGIGSLRHGISTASGPRTVVFDVSGYITLQSPLIIDKPYITVAGQTAPGAGITLRNNTMAVGNTSEVIVRYLRSRMGDVSPQLGERDSFEVYNSSNVIFDHLSASWDSDESLSVSGAIDNITVQWSVMSESLTNHPLPSGGTFGQGAGGLIIAGDGGVTFHHNLYAHNRKRNPYASSYSGHDGLMLDFRNNVVYDWGVLASHGGEGLNPNDTHPKTFMNWVSNYYKTGPSTDPDRAHEIYYVTDYQDDSIYVKGNYLSTHPTWIIDSRQDDMIQGSDEWTQLPTPVAVPSVATDNYLTAYNRVLDKAGASLVRDGVDVRIVNDVRNRTGQLIFSQNDVGGWPTLLSLAPPVDSDRDGMPNLWEIDRGLSPFNPSDHRLDRNNDGYTNLEEYLDWRTHGFAVAGAQMGDADFDGDVDLSDLSSLANYFGTSTGAAWTHGDFDFDGDVDLNDLSSLAGNYGDGTARAFADFESLSNVPEPSQTLFIVLCTMLRLTQRAVPDDRHYRSTLAWT